jgi:hypothetical protein
MDEADQELIARLRAHLQSGGRIRGIPLPVFTPPQPLSPNDRLADLEKQVGFHFPAFLRSWLVGHFDANPLPQYQPGSFEPPGKVYPAVSLAQLEHAEARLGFQLPPLLRELYLQIGNGGFGPAGGLASLFFDERSEYGGWGLSNEDNLVDHYLDNLARQPSDSGYVWPREYIELSDAGGGDGYAVKWTEPDAPVYLRTAYDETSGAWELHPIAPSLLEWFAEWLEQTGG